VRRSSRCQWGEGRANPEVGSGWLASGTLAGATRLESSSGWRRLSEGTTYVSLLMLASGSTCFVAGRLIVLMDGV
jgi:hypothetical protein